jgi:hypothetical protein
MTVSLFINSLFDTKKNRRNKLLLMNGLTRMEDLTNLTYNNLNHFRYFTHEHKR